MRNNSESIGIYFNLLTLFDDLNLRFFSQKITADVRFGKRRNQKAQKRSIRLGSYQPDSKVIIIHPCLDQAIVPKICVERILFHEMLHQHLPAKRAKNGKARIHYREFYDFENTFPYLKEADLWLKANLARLLRY